MLSIGNATDGTCVKTEAEECTTQFYAEHLNWQRQQSNQMQAINMEHEQDVRVIWQRGAAADHWMAARQQRSYEETEDMVGYDLPLEVAVARREFNTSYTRGKMYAPKRKRHASGESKLPEIFRYFGNIEHVADYNVKPGAVSATCNACHARIKGFTKVTSNFIKHLRLKHFEIHAEFVNAKQTGNAEVPETPDTDSFDNRVVSYVIDAALPLDTVEKPSFRSMFEGTHLTVMSRDKLEMLLDDHFNKMQKNIKMLIANQKYICTTADLWSTRERSYFGYTCHWLDKNYKSKSAALACKLLPKELTTEHISAMISRINTEYELNNLKIVANVTDNCANYAKLIKSFGIKMQHSLSELESEAVTLPNNLLPNPIQCASHTLSLVASIDYMQLLDEDPSLKQRHVTIFEKCSALWQKFSCPKSNDIITNVLGEALITPTLSRWNSIYDAICCILLHKEKLSELCSKLSLHNSCFSPNDIQYLEEYRLVMTPIASTIDFLQMESNLYYGCLIPALTSLCIKLKRISDAGEVIDLRNILTALQLKLKARFAKYLTLADDAHNAIIASVLCPSVKMRWFNALARVSVHQRRAEDVHKLIISEAMRHAKAAEHCYNLAAASQKKDDFYDFDDIETSDLDASQPSPIAPATKLAEDVEAQLQNYLQDAGTGFEVLQKYTLLHDLGLKYNTPLSSSAPVERLLSFMHIIRYSKEQDLCDYPFEKLVLMRANSK